MRAERSRGSPIRSQSSRNELIKENIRQGSPALPGFFCFVGLCTAGLGFLKLRLPRIFTEIFLPYVRRRVYKARDDRDDVDAGY